LAIFPGEPGSTGFPLGPPPILEENLWGLVEWTFYGLDAVPATQPSVSKH